MAHNRYPNRRWMFLTSGDAATGVNFNQVMETSPATCRYNVAPTPGTETFVKYNVIEYPQHSGNEPQIPVYSGWRQDSPADQPTWEGEEQYPETAVQGGTDDTYKYDYEVTGSGAYLEYSKPTVTGGGWIENLSIMNGGFGYSADGTLTATGGGGNGFAGTFTSTVGSPVQNLDIVNPGGGYSPEGTLTATGGGGSGFAGTFTTYQDISPASGSLFFVAITNSGENYYEAPTIIVTSEGGVGGTGAVVQASVPPVGIIDSVTITNSGEYYTTNPTVIIDSVGGIDGDVLASVNPGEPVEPILTGTGYYPLYSDNILGSGFFAASGQVTGHPDCFDLALEVEASGGSVINLGIASAGSGYDATGSLTAVGGGGNGFAGTFLAAASGGWVDTLNVVSGGSGYYADGTLVAVGGGGSGFAGTFSQTSGVINSAVIMDQGENYVSAPEIAIVSTGEVDGTGGVVSSSVQLSGALSSVDLENAGWGYSSEPTIIIGTNGTGGAVTPTTNSWSASGYEFDHEETINILRGPNWTPTGIM